MLTREQIINTAVALPQEKVAVPELGGSVYVREMTAGERDRFEDAHNKAEGRDFRARLAAYTACDESGKLLFAEADVPALARLGSTALTRIVLAAKRLNLVSQQEIDDLEKNSGAAPPAGSCSGSPATSAA